MRTYAVRLAMFVLSLAATPSLAQPTTLNGGDPVATQADALGAQQVDTLLLQAEQAARRGRLPLANELVERAETLVLTRSTLAGTETVPLQDGAVARMAAARAALARRDIPAATALMAEAASLARAPTM